MLTFSGGNPESKSMNGILEPGVIAANPATDETTATAVVKPAKTIDVNFIF